MFSHTFMEVRNAVLNAAKNINNINFSNARRGIAIEAKKAGLSRSDLIGKASRMEQIFLEADIIIENSPNHINEFRINERELEIDLQKKRLFWQQNPQATKCDIDSVQNMYTMRANKPVLSLEKSYAILVTNNNAFAQVAWHFGKTYQSSRYVSTVITDFALANVAWLKSPMDAPSLPMLQVLAVSYAALTPPEGFFEKILQEIDKLESKGEISKEKLQLARITPELEERLMQFTLGQDSALTEEIILESINEVYDKIERKGAEKLEKEKQAHIETKDNLSMKITKETNKLLKEQEAHKQTKQEIEDKLQDRCNNRATFWSNTCSYGLLVIIIAIIIITYFIEFGFGLPNLFSWTVVSKAILLDIFTIMGVVYGSFFSKIRTCFKNLLFNHFWDKESKII